MIHNIEKLEGCDKRVKNLVKFCDQIFGTVDVFVLSGYRTRLQNLKCNGASKSQHLKGLAVDLRISDVHCIKVAATLMNLTEVVGIGLNVYSNVCHLDFRSKPAGQSHVFWVYDKNGKAV